MAPRTQNSAAEQKKVVGRPFAPGKSGNPGGVPAHVKKIRDLCGKHSEAAFRTILHLMQRSRSDKIRLAAAEAILDRAGVKAMQIEVTGAEGAPLLPALTVQFVRPIDGGAGPVS